MIEFSETFRLRASLAYHAFTAATRTVDFYTSDAYAALDCVQNDIVTVNGYYQVKTLTVSDCPVFGVIVKKNPRSRPVYCACKLRDYLIHSELTPIKHFNSEALLRCYLIACSTIKKDAGY